MFRPLILSSLLVLCLLKLSAQDDNAPSIRLGVICSPLVSWSRSDASTEKPNGARIGINAGLMVDRFFARNYAVASGVSIHTLGATLQNSNAMSFKTNDGTKAVAAKADVTYKLQYIDIPLALKMRTTQIGNLTIFAQLGLNNMFNIKSNANISSPKLSSVGIKDEVNSFYMGYHAILGIEHKIVGSTAIVGGLSYMNGFTDVTSQGGKAVMHNIELRLGLIF